MVPYGPVWFPMVPYSSVLSCMVPYVQVFPDGGGQASMGGDKGPLVLNHRVTLIWNQDLYQVLMCYSNLELRFDITNMTVIYALW